MDPNNPFTRSFPTSLLDGLWSLLQQLLSLLPRDTALLVTLSGLMFTLFQTWDRILNFIQAWFWCSVRVSDDDSFYPLLLKWSHTMLRTGYHRNLEATTVAFQAWTDKGDIITTDWQGHSLCNYANHMVPYVPFEYTPMSQITTIYFGGHRYYIRRVVLNQTHTERGVRVQREYIEISCYGFSANRLTKLLSHVKKEIRAKAVKETQIFLPKSPFDNGPEWSLSASMQSRSMESVILDDKTKDDLIKDFQSYLLPDSATWYYDRGIPLRRGHLWIGPPGTGKSSCVKAIAGLFGLPIYIIIFDRNMMDVRISQLFSKLPTRAILLLEDIDGIHLSRNGAESSEANLSLTTLLNCLDGVASKEGRIVIMTANHPELLDEALLRPGRVDRTTYFPLLTRTQAAKLFRWMYKDCKTEKVDDMAENFANMIPEGQISPAALSEFLISRKSNPSKAICEISQLIGERYYDCPCP